MFSWSVDKRVDNQQTSTPIFPNGGLINAVPPSTPTTSLEQNPRDTVQQVPLRSACFLLVELLKSIQMGTVITLVSDLHLRWKYKTEPVLRLAINDLYSCSSAIKKVDKSAFNLAQHCVFKWVLEISSVTADCLIHSSKTEIGLS